jgi:serine/threonine-protein kinase
VHRLVHHERGSVYAYRHEIDAWRQLRTTGSASSEASDTRRDLVHTSGRRRLAAAAALVVALTVIGYTVVGWSRAGAREVRTEPSGVDAPVELSPHPEARRLYLKSQGYPRNPGRAQIQRAIEDLEEAVRLDPQFVAAHSLLATAHVALYSFGDTLPRDAIDKGRSHARKALELGPPNAGSYMALGGAAHWYDFDHQAAERHFRDAIAARPHLAGPRSWYAEFLMTMRRFDEALGSIEAAAERDPLWLEVDTVRGNVYLYSRRFEKAVAVYQEVLGRDPNHGLTRYFLGQAYLALGRVSDATIELKRASELMSQPPFSVAALAQALARAGRRSEAEGLLGEMMNRRAQAFYPAFAIGMTHVGLGNQEAALEWLERAYEERLLGYYLPSIDLMWDPLRNHPRFQDMLARLDLTGPLQ